jgi:glutamyl-tRNA synthetase
MTLEGAPPRLRFAPSPSGYLHIGGARTALFNWLWARSQGGSFVLRVEDTDQDRSSIDSVSAILGSLRWLGLDWDEGPEVGGPYGSYFQSERKALYREAVEQLIGAGKAYRCFCTKQELDRQREALKQVNPKSAFVYPGTCRDRTDQPNLPHVVRFKTPRDGSTDFTDKVFGPISTPNAAQQDFVLVRTDGYPLYNLAAVIDDHAMDITLVARGREHIGSTPQQLLLYRAFGWQPPEFAHLPLILSARGEKLSKRDAAVGVQDYRDRGFSAMGVLNYLVRFGWSFGDQEIFSRAELVKHFSWDHVNKSDGKFDEKKFADVAFEHLKREDLTTLDEYEAWVLPFLAKRDLVDVSSETLRAAIPTIRERAKTLVDAAAALDFYVREAPVFDADAQKKFLTAESGPRLLALSQALAETTPWTAALLEERAKQFAEQQALALKDFAQAARVALCGRSASPPLFDVMAVLGRERTLERLAQAAKLASH